MLRIWVSIITTLVLFSLFSINSMAIVGVGLGPTLFDVTVNAGQTFITTMSAYNPYDTDINAEVIVSDNLKDYVRVEPDTVFLEKYTSPEDAKVIKIIVSIPYWTLGNKDIKGEIALRGTGGMVSPAVGSTFYLHIRGMSTLNLALIVIGVILVIVAIAWYGKRKLKK